MSFKTRSKKRAVRRQQKQARARHASRLRKNRDLERSLREAACAGALLDVSEWDERDVPAELLFDVLTGESPLARAVRLRGANVVGRLDLDGCRLRCPLCLERCEFAEPVTLNEARASAIRFIECTLASLAADRLETRANLELTGSTANGELRLEGAHIGGQLSLRGAALRNRGCSLHADGLQVDQDMDCGLLREPGGRAKRRFLAEGEIRLLGARLDELSFEGAMLRNPPGRALSADRVRVAQSMFCRGGFSAEREIRFSAEGEIRLVGAHIGGQLSFSRATLANPAGRALFAERLRVEGKMVCGVDFEARREVCLRGMACGDGFEARGEICLRRAHIDVLMFTWARLANDKGPALDGEGLSVDHDMLCSNDFEANGEVRLAGADIGVLRFTDGARLMNQTADPPRALYAAGITVRRDMSCRNGFDATGEISLRGARIGLLRFTRGARLTNDKGPALDAQGLIVDHGMFCREFRARGEVRIRGTQISQILAFTDGADLINGGGLALGAEGLRVDGDVHCEKGKEKGFRSRGEVRLRGARVAGMLNLNSANLIHPDGVALNADGLTVGRDMFCCGVEAKGEVRLVGAHIGVLSFNKAKLNNEKGATLSPEENPCTPSEKGATLDAEEKGAALSAEALTVDQDMHCTGGFTAEGEVRLRSADVGGELNLNDAQLSNEKGPALDGEALSVKQDMACEGVTAVGGVRLPEAHIDEDVVLHRARLTIPEGSMLERLGDRSPAWERLQVCHGLDPTGIVDSWPSVDVADAWRRLREAGVEPNAAYDAVVALLEAATVLDLREAKVTGRLELKLAARPSGVMDFRSAEVGTLADNDETWPEKLRLQGFRYRELDGDVANPADAASWGVRWRDRRKRRTPPRVDWLELNPDRQLRWLRRNPNRRKVHQYVHPQPYEQLFDFYRRAGRNEAAREVAIRKHRAQRGELSWPMKIWSVLISLTVCYGYCPWRAVYGLFLVIGLGWGVFAWASWDHLHEAKPTNELPEFNPLFYSIDSVLPVVNLGQESAWTPSDFAQYWYVFSAVDGWVAITVLILALTVMVSRGERTR